MIDKDIKKGGRRLQHLSPVKSSNTHMGMFNLVIQNYEKKEDV